MTETLTAEVVEQRRTYRVDAERIDEARAIVKKVNRKAARYGLDGYRLTVGELQQEPVYLRRGQFVDRTVIVGYRGFHDVDLVGAMPRFEGWTFVATIDLSEESGPITRAVPGVEIDLSAHRAEAGRCDYCQKNRHRTDTFVFRHDDGRTVQVGRTCLGPFAGIHGTAGLAWLDGEPAGDLAELGEEREGGGGWAPSSFAVRTLMTAACRVEQMEGWRSRAMAEQYGKPSTSSLTFTAIDPGKDTRDQEWSRKVYAETDGAAAEAKAAAVIEWARTQDGRSEWATNLRTLAGGDTVSSRNAALLVSAIAGYNKEQGIRIEREQRATAEHVGTVGGKITLAGEVVHTQRFPGYAYHSPDRELVLIRGEVDGRPALLKWWSTRPTGHAVGAKVTGSATVKAHETFGDPAEAQTVITRAKLDEAEQPAAG